MSTETVDSTSSDETPGPKDIRVMLNKEPPENVFLPAIDPMLRSLVPVYGERVLPVTLASLGHDGMHGFEDIITADGEVVAQDEVPSIVWEMPDAVATGGLCSAVLSLDVIPQHVTEIMTKAMP